MHINVYVRHAYWMSIWDMHIRCLCETCILEVYVRHAYWRSMWDMHINVYMRHAYKRFIWDMHIGGLCQAMLWSSTIILRCHEVIDYLSRCLHKVYNRQMVCDRCLCEICMFRHLWHARCYTWGIFVRCLCYDVCDMWDAVGIELYKVYYY